MWCVGFGCWPGPIVVLGVPLARVGALFGGLVGSICLVWPCFWCDFVGWGPGRGGLLSFPDVGWR